MQDTNRYHVASGSYRIDTQKPLILEAYLGTCVGVAVYDPVAGIGGLIHLLLPEPISIADISHPEKYASTGFPAFLQALYEAGASAENMKATVAGGATSNLNRDLVCLGATAAEYDAFNAIMMEPGEAFPEVHDAFVKIPAVNIECSLLLRHSFDDGRIGVPDARHVVVHIDIAASVSIVQIHTFTANDFEWFVVEKLCAGTQGKIPASI